MYKKVWFIILALFGLSMIGCSDDPSAEDEDEYFLGATGPAGGLIFYVNPNSDSDGWKYLEAAPAGWSGASYDPSSTWSNVTDTSVDSTLLIAGSGKINTNAIIDQPGHTSSAAKLCSACTAGGKNDWYLPSRVELTLMYLNLYLMAFGDFSGDSYWSSSENISSEAYYVNFYHSGDIISIRKITSNSIRPCRSF